MYKYATRLAVARLVEHRYTISRRMLPHSEYAHYEQFDAILVVTTNSTVYEKRNSSPLLISRSTHSTAVTVIIMW